MKQAITMMRKIYLVFGILCLGTLVFGQNNNPPVGVDDYVSDYGGDIDAYILDNDYDPDGDDLTVTIINPLNHATTTMHTTYLYNQFYLRSIPTSAYIGLDSLTYQICDDGNPILCTTAKLYINILQSSPPIAVNDTLYTTINQTVSSFMGMNDIEIDGQQKYLNLVIAPLNGTANINNSSNTVSYYTPFNGFTGVDSFTYQVCDEYSGFHQLCDTGTVYVFVSPNTAPVAVNDTITDCDFANYNPLFNDYSDDGFWLDTNLVQPPSYGTISFYQYNFFWIYDSDSINPTQLFDTIAYRICDHSDSMLCDTAFIFINIPPANFLQVDSITHTSEICNNGEGEITFHVPTYAQPYRQYLVDENIGNWNNPHITNLNTGIYYPKIRSGFCTKSLSPITITQNPTTPVIDSVDIFNTNLINSDTIIIHATSSASIEYSIDGGTTWQGSNTFTNLSSGTYIVKVRSSGSCVIDYVNNPVVLPSINNGLSITEVIYSSINNCGYNDGAIAIQMDSMNMNYVYSIDSGSTWVAQNIFMNLDTGTYHILVRDTVTLDTIFYALPIVINAPTPPVIDSIFSTAPTQGNNDGTLTIIANSPNTFLEYSISGGINWQNSNVFTGLAQGAYYVCVRNINGSCEVCEAYGSLGTQSIVNNISYTTTNPTGCNTGDGTITISVDSSSNYHYSIDYGQTWQSDSVFQNLGIGYYTIYLKELSNNAVIINPLISYIHITSSVNPTISNVVATSSSSCSANDASITINLSGTGNYIYSLNNGNWQSSNTFTGLSTGYQNIKISLSDFSCSPTLHSVYFVDSTKPVLYGINQTFASNCGDGHFYISANSFTGGVLEYSIDNGSTWTLSNIFDNLSSGNYNIIVRKVGTNCTVSTTRTLYGHYDLQNISTTHTNPTTCNSNDGTITIYPLDSDYEYSIDGGTWSSSNIFTGLSCGDYYLRVRRQNGTCFTHVGWVSLNANNFITSVNHTNLTGCNGTDGTITIQTVTNSNLEYSIDNGFTWLSNIGNFTNLDTGSYYVMVREVGTMNIDTFANNPVIITASPPLNIANITSTDATCGANNGTATVIPTGGTPPYTYLWNSSAQSTQTITGLSSGTYYVTVTDAVGCTDTASVVIATTPFPTITSMTITDVSICGANDGTATVNHTSGISPHTYLWSSGQTTQTITNLSTGTYHVTVTDINGCSDTASGVVSGFVSPVITNITSTNPTDCSVNDGTITILTNGTGQELYTIDSGSTWQSTNIFTGLVAGTYDPTNIGVTNINSNCTSFGSGSPIILNSPILPIINTVNVIQPITCSSTGSVQISAIGSNLEYSIDGGISWQTTSNFNNF